MRQLILVRFGEIGLKGKNRRSFEDRLLHNMRFALQGSGKFNIIKTHGRIFVETEPCFTNEAMERLQRVFGIVSVSPVFSADLEMTSISSTALEVLRASGKPEASFKVETRRANKAFPYNSQEVSRLVGAYLLKNTEGTRVDVHNPDIKIDVEIREKEAYIYSQTLPGIGGLPVGVAGKAVLLLSGGIDSPVAGWLALKRGVLLEALHFHSPPFTSERAKMKAVDLCRILAGYGGAIWLHITRFTEIQKALRTSCPPELSVTLMRRMMFRVAERIGQAENALALVTGESLGQVASQTLENIAVINAVTCFPVLRPLIGFDKEEIIQQAHKINTYTTSIRPYEDCCTLFVPRHPVTRPRLTQIEEAEKNLNIDSLVTDCLAQTEVIEISPEG